MKYMMDGISTISSANDVCSSEEQELLSKQRGKHCFKECDSVRNHCDKIFPTGFCNEFSNLFHLSWPIFITYIAESLIAPLSLMFCGHLSDPIMLTAAGLAISIINVSVVAVATGMATACTAHFSQCYGSENRSNLGVLVQKALIIFMITALFVISLHMNMGYILEATGQDSEISILVGEYLIIFIPGTVSYFAYFVLRKYLESQSIVIPIMIITITVDIINCVLHYFFLYYYSWQTWGSALSMSISYASLVGLTVLYIFCRGIYKNTWNGWSWICLDDWASFYKLAFFGMVGGCAETWYLETGVVISGLIGKIDLASQAVLINIEMAWIQIAFGLSTASFVRVGQYLGSGNTDGAITVYRVALLTIVCITFVIPSILFGFKDSIISIFTSDVEIAALSSKVYHLLYCFMFFDGVSIVSKGVLYAAEKHVFVGLFTFITCWCLAVPVVIPLMLKTYLRTTAFWIVCVVVLVIQDIILLLVIYKLNWGNITAEVQKRASEGSCISVITPSNTSFRNVIIKRIIIITLFVSICCISILIHACLSNTY